MKELLSDNSTVLRSAERKQLRVESKSQSQKQTTVFLLPDCFPYLVFRQENVCDPCKHDDRIVPETSTQDELCPLM